MNKHCEQLKKRSANFTYSETELLCRLITKFATIIESKKTDAHSWKEENEAWERLAIEFNGQNKGAPRSATSLKAKYEGIKKDLRKKVAKNKSETFKTGGGVPNIKPLTSYEELIYNIITLSVEGLPSRFDDDYVLKETEPNVEDLLSTPTNISAVEDTTETIVFDVYEDEEEVLGTEENFCSQRRYSPEKESDSQLQSVVPDNYKIRPRKRTLPETPSSKPQEICHLLTNEDEATASSPQQTRWNPNLLKKPSSKVLQVNKNKLTKLQAAEKVSLLAESKKELLQLQIVYTKKEIEFQDCIFEKKKAKVEEEIKSIQLEREIKKIEKQIKEETLKNLLNRPGFGPY